MLPQRKDKTLFRLRNTFGRKLRQPYPQQQETDKLQIDLSEEEQLQLADLKRK